VFSQGFSLGGARFGRLEGAWYGDSAVYFVSTSGGDAGLGQIWEYRPKRNGGTLTLIFESSSVAEMDGPDNITVSPSGGLLVCEDGDDDQYLRGLTPRGEIFDFALNLQTSHEWAGATFAVAERQRGWEDRGRNGRRGPSFVTRSDRQTLYVNRQGATGGANPPAPGTEGMTFAIWGPWHEGAL
jgi:secreted PhoX family phosphatase